MNNGILIGVSSLTVAAAVALGIGELRQLVERLNSKAARSIGERMTAVGIDTSRLPLYLCLWRAGTAGTFFALWFACAAPLLAISLAFLVHQLGPIVFDIQIDARRRRLNEQTAGVARTLAGEVRVGMPLGAALQSVARSTHEPMGIVLRRATQQLDQGKAVRDVLADVRQWLKIDSVALMTSALLVAAESGGKLADVLDKISTSLDEFQRVQRKREADTASGRLMVRLMAVFPGGFFALTCVTSPDLTTLMFTTFAGQLVLAAAVVLTYLAVRWARHILARTG